MKCYNIQMMRQMAKRVDQETKNDEDLNFLLNNVRSRENGLVFFLELFSMASRSRIQLDQYRIYKQQFLDKQRINTSQIKQLSERLIAEPLTNSQIRSFWLKLKSILRVSLERTRTMGFLNEVLSRKYQEVIGLIDSAHEQSAQLKDYLRVQQLLKKRTVEALITTKQILIDSPDGQIANKNRSETFLKLSSKPTQSLNLSPNHPKTINVPLDVDPPSLKKLKSITRVKKRTEKQKGRNIHSPVKKALLAWQKYERTIADVMDCKFEGVIDKKKSKGENQDRLYQQLFDRNIANHKVITKFAHNSSKLQAIIQMARQKMTQKRLNRGVRPSQTAAKSEISNKLTMNKLIGRPKTSKKVKGNAGRILSGQSQKFTEVKI